MTGILLHDIFGPAFDAMPDTVRRMHGIETTQNAVGMSRIRGGTNPLSWFVRIIAALPGPARRVPVQIRFIKGPDREEWDRRIGNSRLRTVVKQEGPYLTERLAALPVTFVYEACAGRRGFSLHAVQVRFLGLPLPRLLRPTVTAHVGEWRGRYRFSVLAAFWFCGRVVSYAGYLDPPEPVPATPPFTIVYDGLCHLCSSSVAWIAHRVDDGVRFVPVQSGEGAEALQAAGLNALDPDSFLVVKDGRSLQKSRAVIAVLQVVGGGWSAAALLLRLLPRPVADSLYGSVAANRYRWFGKRTACFIPRQSS
jgi:predicted DCC family thiol-disulfide oxidoreductase YuxK